jgi:hypothetical protein
VRPAHALRITQLRDNFSVVPANAGTQRLSSDVTRLRGDDAKLNWRYAMNFRKAKNCQTLIVRRDNVWI